MVLYFITGNKNKLKEIRSMIPNIRKIDMDLDEIQEIDPKKIIRAKMNEALKHHDGEFIIEDTSLYLDCLNGLPGPLIKWFMKTIGNEGLSDIALKSGNTKATAKTIIGYARSNKKTYFFTGSVKGNIIRPKGKTSFGWDPIFQPKGYKKSFAQMTRKQKNEISMRKKAAKKLKKFLESQ